MNRRLLTAAVAPVTALALLAGCGSTTSPGTTGTVAGATTPVATDATTPAPGATAAACPTENTQTFAKTRFVLNLGLALGAVNQWVVKPYRAGTFATGAEGRTTALVKAGLATGFAAKQVSDAVANVKADPTLCGVLAAPLTKVADLLEGLKDKIGRGDLSVIDELDTSLGGVVSEAEKHGLKITEQKVDSFSG